MQMAMQLMELMGKATAAICVVMTVDCDVVTRMCVGYMEMIAY